MNSLVWYNLQCAWSMSVRWLYYGSGWNWRKTFATLHTKNQGMWIVCALSMPWKKPYHNKIVCENSNDDSWSVTDDWPKTRWKSHSGQISRLTIPSLCVYFAVENSLHTHTHEHHTVGRNLNKYMENGDNFSPALQMLRIRSNVMLR